MIDTFIPKFQHPLRDIKVDLGKEKPLWQYIQKAIQDIEIINILGLNPIDNSNSVSPFIHCINWEWNPHPPASEIQDRRRETGDKLSTKYIEDTRVGILKFDIYCGARDKNRCLETRVIPNKVYVPIEDEQGRFLYGNMLYTKYQLVDKFIYPAKGGYDHGYIIKSLLPIEIHKDEISETSIDGAVVTGERCEVKIFNTMESILSCFMHIIHPLSYLSCFPMLQFSDRVIDEDKDKFYYFKPLEDAEIYVKAHKEAVATFSYIRSVLVMACDIIRKHKPVDLEQMNDTKWWVYQLSYYENAVEHRGACNEMHVARMLDTITAEILPIPECDKRTMMTLLRYALMSEFGHVNIFDYKNKRFRLNEAISTIVTAEVSAKLKKMFKFGNHISMNDMEQQLRFNPKMLIRKLHSIGIVESIDFANDLDYYQLLRMTKSGPNSLGRNDKHKIKLSHKQLHPSMMGVVDLLYSSKDVGQNGMISPYADLSGFNDSDPNENPNIEYDLYNFIEYAFPDHKRLTFNAKNQREYKNALDKLIMTTYVNLNYHPLEVDSNPESYGDNND